MTVPAHLADGGGRNGGQQHDLVVGRLGPARTGEKGVDRTARGLEPHLQESPCPRCRPH